MAGYESVIILKPTIDEDTKNKKIKKYEEFIGKLTNDEVKTQDLGKKTLAYDVKNNKEGYFAVFNFKCNSRELSQIEDKYRKDEDVIKFMDIRQDERFDEYEDSEEDEEEM